MITMLFVAHLFASSPIVLDAVATATHPHCCQHCCMLAIGSPLALLADAAARLRASFEEATMRLTARINSVRTVVGRVMRLFTASMLGSRAFSGVRSRN